MERIFMRMEKKLNSNHLKIIAIIAMTIDHATDLFYPAFPAQPLPIMLHILGRLTAPIMWFFVAEGYYYTHNVLNKFSICQIDCKAFRATLMALVTTMKAR